MPNLAACTLLLAAIVPAAAQSPTAPATPPLHFEVASIRPHQFAGDEPSNRRISPGGRFTATATTVRTLLRIAFATEDNRVLNAPRWVDTDLFDIDATTANHAEVTTPQQFQQLLLSLLEDRFQLKFHREQKQGPVYFLLLVKNDKLGPALKPSLPETKPNVSSNSNATVSSLTVAHMSIADIAAALQRQTGRPVLDRTGLDQSAHTGLINLYDFQIQWSPENNPDNSPEASLPGLFTVLKEQLGLKLQPARAPIETIFIDHLSHPTPN